MKPIDLRSDTVTHPTPAMRRAMAEAELGDDVFGDDPTVNRLEEMAAVRMGKAAAMLVPSGTMANLAAVMAHCGRGDEVILGEQSHTFLYEAGGVAVLGSIHPHTLPNRPDGTLDPAAIESAIRPDNVHFPRSRLICLENTHNRCAGVPLGADYTARVAGIARRHNLKLHIDGARIFNAAVALNCPVTDLTRDADSVSFCLSKGLACPIGSLLCGPAEFIRQARRIRKVLGGGMRQAGIIAAAGIVALSEMIDRLADDHANARKLAEGLAEIPGIAIDPAAVRTNIVYFDLNADAARFVRALDGRGVRVISTSPTRCRAVTHYGIESADIDAALKIIGQYPIL